jgi:hypothetical protein
MHRRGFVIGFASLAAALLVNLPIRAGALLQAEPDALRRLAATFHHPGSAAAIGRTYLRQYPGEAEAQRLASEITSDLDCLGCRVPSADEASLRAAVRERVRRDFAEGVVVSVDGWVLSRTEARLCAIAALA